ncbi:Six-hairpin glycosidase-like protein [Xylariales sp. PMI_506]|nr:Six-hairpin glycosidase-like protein [Xylariales sp. PMI_506]
MTATEVQNVINQLQANWVWVPDWIDSTSSNSAGRLVRFRRILDLPSGASRALLHFSADTRYKLYVNGQRVAVGPARSSPLSFWYYDTLDIAPYLREGQNEIVFVVLRYFSATRHAMPFARTPFPGLTVIGSVETEGGAPIELNTLKDWEVRVDDSVLFPAGLVDDVFLHISERVAPATPNRWLTPKPYGFRTLNGELAPWRLRPREIPAPEESHVAVSSVRACTSSATADEWSAGLSTSASLTLPGGSSHTIELQADVHSTAFLKWTFKATQQSHIQLKVTYSEGYELEPRAYPFFRTKADRLDAKNGHLIGPFDEVHLELPAAQVVTYEPFWFRTFRVLRLEITVGPEPVEVLSFGATQVNYPLAVKAAWKDLDDADSDQIWDVSIRTLRNCMFDGYSDCPFYEQLQYSGDSRSVGLFHYLLSGDDRPMRQAIANFAASVTFEGLTQSRFPSHVPQVIVGFSLYWILQICDHHLYFGDTKFARSFLPRIDGIFEFYDAHIDEQGLVSGFPEDVWQYVDWVTTWGATDDHPDKGVPTSGRKTNRHTYFSMLYAYVLKEAAQLLRDVGRPGHAAEYEARAASIVEAVAKHCYDGRFFTDSTADVADKLAYSQHCQVFGVLCGAVPAEDRTRILTEALDEERFSKCSYVMKFYMLRAFALAGDEIYETFWATVWNPWRNMLANNLSTWEEDDVRQRSDCHAWGSVPIYEYCTELAGIRPVAAGSSKVLFKPRLGLSKALDAKVALGSDNTATISWSQGADGQTHVNLQLQKAISVTSILPGGKEQDHGLVDYLTLVHAA